MIAPKSRDSFKKYMLSITPVVISNAKPPVSQWSKLRRSSDNINTLIFSGKIE